MDCLYFFPNRSNIDKFFEEIEDCNRNGNFLGYSFKEYFTHTCYTSDQCEMIERILEKYNVNEYQKKHFLNYNSIEDTVLLQPFVQWLPYPIYSCKFNQYLQKYDDGDWGISMEGHIVLSKKLSAIVQEKISGLNQLEFENDYYDFFTIDKLISEEHYKVNEELPLELDCSKLPFRDIYILENGAIIISNSFAKLLSKYWNGIPNARFQIVSSTIPDEMKKLCFRKVKNTKNEGIADDLILIENYYTMKFPSKYREWIISRERVPALWLSPRGGVNSEIVKTTEQEYHETEPALSKEMVVIGLVGDGNLICYNKKDKKFYEWDHETGESTFLARASEFNKVVDTDI